MADFVKNSRHFLLMQAIEAGQLRVFTSQEGNRGKTPGGTLNGRGSIRA